MSLYFFVLFSIRSTNFIISLGVAVLLLLPLDLVHIQNGMLVQNVILVQNGMLIQNGMLPQKDTVFVIAQAFCEMPRNNVNVTDRDLTVAMYLPEGTILFNQLSEIAKCKAATNKINVSNADCFCLGLWLIYVCGLLAVFTCVFTILEAVFTLLKLWSFDNETPSGLCSASLSWLIHLFIFISILVSMDTFSAQFRYTLPNAVYDQKYYEIPSVWSAVLSFSLLNWVISSFELYVICTAQVEETKEKRKERKMLKQNRNEKKRSEQRSISSRIFAGEQVPNNLAIQFNESTTIIHFENEARKSTKSVRTIVDYPDSENSESATKSSHQAPISSKLVSAKEISESAASVDMKDEKEI